MVSSRSFKESTMVCSSISFNFPSNISPSKVSIFNFRPIFFLYCHGRESGLSIPGDDTSRLNAPSIRSSSSILFESFLLINEHVSIGRPASPSINTKTRWFLKIRSRLNLPKTILETHSLWAPVQPKVFEQVLSSVVIIKRGDLCPLSSFFYL